MTKAWSTYNVSKSQYKKKFLTLDSNARHVKKIIFFKSESVRKYLQVVFWYYLHCLHVLTVPHQYTLFPYNYSVSLLYRNRLGWVYSDGETPPSEKLQLLRKLFRLWIDRRSSRSSSKERNSLTTRSWNLFRNQTIILYIKGIAHIRGKKYEMLW